MNHSTYRFTLDLHSSQSQISIPVTQYDTARVFLINLSDGGLPYHIEKGCYATIDVKRPKSTPFQEFCAIEKNAIRYDFSQYEYTAAIPGVHDCEITLYDADGMILGAPRFTMIVTEKAVNGDDINLDDDDRAILNAAVAQEITRQVNEEARQIAERQRQENFPITRSIYGYSESSLNMIDESGSRSNSENVEYDGDSIVIKTGGYYFPFATVIGYASDENDDVIVMVKCKDTSYDSYVKCCISEDGRVIGTNTLYDLERMGEWLVKKFKVSNFNEDKKYCVLRCDSRHYDKDVTIEGAIISIGAYAKAPKGVNKTAYVNGNAGNDINSGSLAAPFKTIQRAIDSGATVIRVASGDYHESLTISRRENISILPSEMSTYNASIPDTPKIHITGGENKDFANAIKIEHCENVTLEGIWFDNVKSDIAVIDKCFNLNITDCWFSNNESEKSMGLLLYNVNGVIRNCKAFNIVMDGFNIHGYGNTQFIDCVAYDCGDDGISHHDGNTGAIIGGEYYNCGKGGVSSPCYGAYVDIINVYSHDNAYGIYADSTSDNRNCKAMITGCLLKNNAVADVYANRVDLVGWKNVYDTKIVTDTATFVEDDATKIAIEDNRAAIAYNRSAIEENQAAIATNTEKLTKIKSNVKNLEAQVYGKSKNFVCDSFEEFVAFCNGADPTLTTSDNVLIIENGVPDFWFEATTDETRLASAGTYTYNGVEYPLVGKDAEGNPVGVFHVLEGDFTEIKELLKGKVDNNEKVTSANALKGKVIGNPVTFDDVDLSPLAHDALCKLVSKNILPYPYRNSTTIIQGVTFTDNGDGTITVNGTATADIIYAPIKSSTLYLPKGTYTFSGITNGDYGTVYLQGKLENNSGFNSYVTTKPNTFTLTEDGNFRFNIRITNGSTYENFVIRPQLERGKVATPYTPYMEDFSNIEVTVTTGEGESTTYTPDMNGSVTIPSVTKDTVITSIPDVVIEAEYNVDTNVVPRDYVKKTDYASATEAGVVKVNDTNMAFGLRVIRNGTLDGVLDICAATTDLIDAREEFKNPLSASRQNNRHPIVPATLDYAVKAALSDCRITWTDEEKMAALDLLGVSNLAFRTLQNSGDKLELPNMVGRYAQITEIHGMDSKYFIGMSGTFQESKNYPVQLLTNDGVTLFEMPSDVLTRLTDFGFRGNYIFFDNGKAFYHQSNRAYYPFGNGGNYDNYINPPLEEGEQVVDKIENTMVIIKLASPVITDISDYITTDGIIDIGDAEYITVVPSVSEEEVKGASFDGNTYTFRFPTVKILVETYGGNA